MKLVAYVLSFVFFAQTAAFAVDPIQASQNSERSKLALQRSMEGVQSRYEKLSDAKKLKYLERQEKRLNKLQKAVTKMSDKKFERVKNKLESIEMDAKTRNYHQKNLLFILVMRNNRMFRLISTNFQLLLRI